MKRILQNLTLTYFLLFFSSISFADELTVVYPIVKAPYDRIFKNITSGIESEFQGSIAYVRLSSNSDVSKISKAIKSDKVIALGRRGLSVAKVLSKNKTVLVGALPIKPNGVAGVSLTASPVSLFDSLGSLAPNVKKVFVLYSSSSAWIIGEAKKQADLANLELIPIAVNDLRSAVEKYDQIFENEELSNSAIWLPLDSITAHEKVVVPNILERAWNEKMVVFSSKPIHAKRGALFSAMPHNVSMGKQLAQMLNNVNRNQQPSDVKPMNKIKIAVNLRTAAHLGINYNNSQKSEFDLTFPK